jgi:hypothetical protein
MSRIVFYSIGICFIHALTSCHEIEEKIILKPQHTGQNISCIQSLEVDSSTLEKIKIDIHAEEKAFQIDTFFNAKIKNSHFNGCILVAQKGVVLYNKSIGVTTFKKNESDSLTADTKFQLASLSKTFTAVATLKLIEENKLSLDDSVQKFFPLFPYKTLPFNYC